MPAPRPEAGRAWTGHAARGDAAWVTWTSTWATSKTLVPRSRVITFRPSEDQAVLVVAAADREAVEAHLRSRGLPGVQGQGAAPWHRAARL